MGFMSILDKALSLGNRLSEVFFGERRKRTRLKIKNLQKKIDKLYERPPSNRLSRKIEKLENKIYSLKSYLEAD